MRNLTLLTAVTALSLSLPAQMSAGDVVPDFKIDAALNQAPADFSDLSGRAVLIELFATW